MSEYNMSHTGRELDDAINKVKNDYIDKSKVTHFATGIVPNVTAGQAIKITGITDEKTEEAFDVKGVLAFIQPTANLTVYPSGHAAAKPAVFAFVRDEARTFGIAMACAATSGSASYVREVRLNTDIGGVTNQPNTDIIISGNGFEYTANTGMYGVIAAQEWRWVAWG